MNPFRDLARNWKSNVPVLASMTFLAVVSLMSIFAPLIAPHSPLWGEISHKFRPPFWVTGGSPTYLLGTDQVGRDILSRIIYGGRVSLSVAVLGVFASGLIGISLGVVSGFYGGLIDQVLMRIVDIVMSLPMLLIAVTIVAFMGKSVQNIVIVLGITGWMTYARIVRACTMSTREKEYVLAARAIGVLDFGIIRKHILPNIFSPIVIVASFTVAQMILIEAALDFLGMGIQPPTPTWGVMLADARNYLTVAWWPTAFPGLFIMLSVLSVNLIGDWLRDALDPRLRI
jgi:peptide/nickel transport system permease protein